MCDEEQECEILNGKLSWSRRYTILI